MIKIFLYTLLVTSFGFSQDSSSTLHRLRNYEIELEMLKNSISTQEQSRESLEKEVSRFLKATRESLRDTREGLSHKQNFMDKALDKLVQDCKQLKSHSNELSSTVNELIQSLQNIKETSKQQGQAIKELEQAMRALTLALVGKNTTRSSDKTALYTVKSGDSLEKIAHAHNMSINELRELNELKQSTIYLGQELRVVNHGK